MCRSATTPHHTTPHNLLCVHCSSLRFIHVLKEQASVQTCRHRRQVKSATKKVRSEHPQADQHQSSGHMDSKHVLSLLASATEPFARPEHKAAHGQQNQSCMLLTCCNRRLPSSGAATGSRSAAYNATHNHSKTRPNKNKQVNTESADHPRTTTQRGPSAAHACAPLITVSDGPPPPSPSRHWSKLRMGNPINHGNSGNLYDAATAQGTIGGTRADKPAFPKTGWKEHNHK